MIRGTRKNQPSESGAWSSALARSSAGLTWSSLKTFPELAAGVAAKDRKVRGGKSV